MILNSYNIRAPTGEFCIESLKHAEAVILFNISKYNMRLKRKEKTCIDTISYTDIKVYN